MDAIGLVSALTQGFNAYKTAVATLDEAKIATATNELTVQLAQIGGHVFAMQEKAFQATEREAAALTKNRKLEKQVRKLKKRNRDFSRYELVESHPGTFTLCIKESARNGEPVHHLCPSCRDNKSVKSILQTKPTNNALSQCPSCKTDYRTADQKRPTPTRASSQYLQSKGR